MSVALGYLLSVVVSAICGSTFNSAQLVNTLNIINIIVITAIPTLVYVLFNRETFAGSFKKFPWKEWIKYILILPVIWMTSTYLNVATNKFLSRLGIILIKQLPSADNHTTLVTGFLLACVVAPIFEELFYRGVILSLLKGYGSGAAIVISAALFALGHNSVTILVSPFVLGMFLAYVTLRSENVVLAMVLHFESNLISWFLTNIEKGQTISVLITIFTLTLGAATAVFAVIKLIKNFDRVKIVLKQILQYLKNPLWIPILANYIYINTIKHG